MKVRMSSLRNIVLALLSVVSIDAAGTAPHLVYGTYLGGRDKECATGISVDRSGAAYVVGRTPLTRLSGHPTCIQHKDTSE
jgi:hypothetical protein